MALTDDLDQAPLIRTGTIDRDKMIISHIRQNSNGRVSGSGYIDIERFVITGHDTDRVSWLRSINGRLYVFKLSFRQFTGRKAGRDDKCGHDRIILLAGTILVLVVLFA